MKSNEISPSTGPWVGLLLPPVAWAVQMQILYVLVRPECTSGRKLAMLVAVCLALAAIFIAFISAFLNYQLPALADESNTRSRQKFMAGLGLLSSAVFFLVTLAQGIAVIVFHPCQL